MDDILTKDLSLRGYRILDENVLDYIIKEKDLYHYKHWSDSDPWFHCDSKNLLGLTVARARYADMGRWTILIAVKEPRFKTNKEFPFGY